MKTRMTRLAVAATAILTATLGFQPNARSAPTAAELNFGGTVPSVCTFANPVAGKIGLNSDNTGLGSNGDWYNSGVGASVDISCSGAAALTVADPVQTSGPTTTTKNAAIVYTSAGTVNSPTGTFTAHSLSLPAGFAQTGIWINVDNFANTAILGGNYSYKVLLTATPN